MIAAVSMVKDEADVVFDTVSRMMEQVDLVIVADNQSTDGTREILDQFPNLVVIDDHDPAYYQSRKMTGLAQHAADMGAEWVIPFDADEVWLSAVGDMRHTFANLPPEALIAEATLVDHVATAADPPGPPIRSMHWRRAMQAPLRKVAVRTHPGLQIHQGNHSATFKGVRHPLTVTGQLEVRHFPYRSPEQLIRKARNGGAAYAASDLPKDVGAHWRGYARILEEQGEQALREVFFKWYYRENPEDAVVIDGERQDALVCDPL